MEIIMILISAIIVLILIIYAIYTIFAYIIVIAFAKLMEMILYTIFIGWWSHIPYDEWIKKSKEEKQDNTKEEEVK